MKTIFSRTLETTLKKISIILFVLVGAACGYILAKSTVTQTKSYDYNSLLNYCLMIQHLFVFFGINGVVLFCNIIENGTGLIANEIHEGTFKLLAAKPNSRSMILLGKLLGAVTGCFILMVLSLLSYYGALGIFKPFDGNIMAELFEYLPVYILYGTVVIVIVMSVSVLLSCVVKRKVAAMLPLLALMIVIFAVFPFYRLIGEFTGGNTVNAMIDLNYHFASIFKCCVSLKGEIAKSSIMASMTNLFSYKTLDADVVRTSYTPSVLYENTTINAQIAMIAYLVIAATCCVGSFAILKKKDI